MTANDTCMFPGFLTPVLTQVFYPKPLTTFPNCVSEVRGENRRKECLPPPGIELETSMSQIRYVSWPAGEITGVCGSRSDQKRQRSMTSDICICSSKALFRARWYGKHTYLSSLGMLGTIQLNSILFADHIKFNDGYIKRAYTRQRMSNDNYNNERKQV